MFVQNLNKRKSLKQQVNGLLKRQTGVGHISQVATVFFADLQLKNSYNKIVFTV